MSVSIADGDDITKGRKTDAAATDVSSAWSVVAILKGLLKALWAKDASVLTSASFTRPNDTTAYATGDLVANNANVGSVAALTFAVLSTLTLKVCRAKLKKSGTTTTLATFRLHLFVGDPAASTGLSNGDNGALAFNDTAAVGYRGFIDLDMTGNNGRVNRDSAMAIGVPAVGTEILIAPTGAAVYGLLEALAGYTPAANEVFTVELEAIQN